MASYYLNAGSSTQDGLTPTTGYHTITALLTAITLIDNDTINVVGNLVEPVNNNINITTILTIQSWSGNTQQPTWYCPNNAFNITGAAFTLRGIKFTSATTPIGDWCSFYFNGDGGTSNNCKNYLIEKCYFTKWLNLDFYNTVSGTIQNNIFENNFPVFVNTGTYNQDVNGLFINNNTMVNPGAFAFYSNFQCNVTNFRSLNNIFQTNSLPIISQSVGIVTSALVDYNIDNVTSPINPLWSGTHNIHHTDSLLANPAGGDYSLQSGSPCIDAGTSNSIESSVPIDDFIGTVRPQGITTDIGCYEHIFPARTPSKRRGGHGMGIGIRIGL